jgi:hypothetical protein
MAWDGLIYAHVFENLEVGIPRTLFWNLLLTPGLEDEWTCRALVERHWLIWLHVFRTEPGW